MLTIEPGCRGNGHEKLAAVGAGARVGHRKNSGLAVFQVGTEFVRELITGAASAGTERVSTLNHEVFDDAMENGSIIKRFLFFLSGFGIGPFFRAFREAHEVFDRLGSFVRIEFNGERPFVCFEYCEHLFSFFSFFRFLRGFLSFGLFLGCLSRQSRCGHEEQTRHNELFHSKSSSEAPLLALRDKMSRRNHTGFMIEKIVSRPAWVAAIFLLVGLAIYASSLNNRFLLDDESQVAQNALIQDLSNVHKYFLGSTMNAQSEKTLGGIYYKPIMTVCYAVLWWIAPNDPFQFHLFQLLLAVANSLLALLLMRRHLSPAVAAMMALIFLVHPLNSEVVVYIADLQDVLYTFFGLLALNCLASGASGSPWTLVSVGVLLFMSMLSKESGILYVVICGVYAGLFRKEMLKKLIGVSLLVLAVYFYLRIGVANLKTLSYHQNQIGRADLTVRLLTAPLVLISYLIKFVFPRDITATQDWVIKEASWSDFWLPLIADVLILAAAFLFAKRQWKTLRQFAFYTFWVFMGMGFHSHIVVPLDGTVADRWFYFSSLGLVAMIGILIDKYAVHRMRAVALGIALFWSLGLGVRSHLRSLDWYDNYTLCEHDLKIFPDSYDMHNNLGVEYFRRGRIDEARVQFEKSVQLAPGWDVNWNNLGSVYYRYGYLQKAEEYYLKSMSNGPYYMAYENYASVLIAQGRFSEAKAFIKNTALPLFPASGPLRELERKVESY